MGENSVNDYTEKVRPVFRFQQYVDGKSTTPLLMELGEAKTHQDRHCMRNSFSESVYKQYDCKFHYELIERHPEVAALLTEVINQARKQSVGVGRSV